MKSRREVLVLLAVVALIAAPRSAGAAETAKSKSAPAPPQASSDSSMTIRGGESGKEFRSMTVEGEDRVHVDFGRPELVLDLDPQDVPGLSRCTALDGL